MGRSVPHNLKSTHQTEFVKIFNSLCGRYGRWEIWQDFVTLAAIAISNTVDRSQAAEREKTYMTIAGKYKPEEMLKFSQMLQEVVIGMDFNPDQDFLGELYMALDLGNDHAGQFFTPYDVCRLMAEITDTDLQARVERDGWISVNDCACGAGALLVAFANACTRQKINYQTSVLFTAQDIDYIVGLMCYLQLSLMGCAGYVVIGDSLLHPSTALDRRGLIPPARPEHMVHPVLFPRHLALPPHLGADGFTASDRRKTRRASYRQVKIVCRAAALALAGNKNRAAHTILTERRNRLTHGKMDGRSTSISPRA